MIDFATIEATLKTLLSSLSSDVEADRLPVRLEDEAEEALGDLLRAEISIGRGKFRTLGVDDRRTEYDENAPAGEEMGDTLCSLRRGAFRIKCTALEVSGSESAWHYLEAIRGRLSRRGARAALRSVGVGLIECTETVDLSRALDKRHASLASFDMLVHVTANEADPERFTYIESVEVGAILDGDPKPSVILEPEE